MDKKRAYSLLRSNTDSTVHVLFVLLFSFTVLTVSIGKTPESVFLATANFPFPSLVTAVQPPNSSISFISPGAIPLVLPISSIVVSFFSFSTVLGKSFNLVAKSSTFALSSGAVYTRFASGSVSAAAVGLASTARFLRDFGLLLSVVAVSSAGFVVATDVVDGSSAFTVVCSLFSRLFASADDASVFFSANFSSVVEVVDDTTGAGVASAGFEVVVSA